MTTGFAIGEVSWSRQLGNYYIDYAQVSVEMERGAIGPMDSSGVPLADYDLAFRGHPAADPSRRYGAHYTPVTIAEHGLGLWARWLEEPSQELRERFLVQADWFLASLRQESGFGVWLHGFEFPVFNLKPHWVSAMAQGQGISVLLRAFQLTGRQEYLDASRSAFEAFGHDIHAGGVSCEVGGYLWLEEFPTRPPSHVLNGLICALWGVLDYFRVTESPHAKRLWDRGISTVRDHLPRYEMAAWSRYDLLGYQIASEHYHRLHVRQLEVLAGLTGDPVFADYHRRWLGFLHGDRKWRRWCEKKVRGLLHRTGLIRPPRIAGVSIEHA